MYVNSERSASVFNDPDSPWAAWSPELRTMSVGTVAFMGARGKTLLQTCESKLSTWESDREGHPGCY